MYNVQWIILMYIKSKEGGVTCRIFDFFLLDEKATSFNISRKFFFITSYPTRTENIIVPKYRYCIKNWWQMDIFRLVGCEWQCSYNKTAVLGGHCKPVPNELHGLRHRPKKLKQKNHGTKEINIVLDHFIFTCIFHTRWLNIFVFTCVSETTQRGKK